MVYVLAISVLIIWAVLIMVMVRQVLRKPTCPECGGQFFEAIDMRTAIIDYKGEKIPAAWMYRRCKGCKARLKWDVGANRWVELEPGEWQMVVENAEEVPESDRHR